MHDSLFQPIALGAIEAPNRIVMAPLTRGRASAGSVPNAMMVEYYRQRAGAGLIITEATGISVEGLGWPAVIPWRKSPCYFSVLNPNLFALPNLRSAKYLIGPTETS